MAHVLTRTRRSTLARTRAMPAAARHGCGAGMVGAMAALPVLGLPVLPEGQPFLLVFAILFAALLFGRATALSAALVATAAGAVLLTPAAAGDPVRTGMSLVAFLVVALGLASAVEAMRRVFSLMDVADLRRAEGLVPVAVETRPGAMRLLMMSPEQRRARPSR